MWELYHFLLHSFFLLYNLCSPTFLPFPSHNDVLLLVSNPEPPMHSQELNPNNRNIAFDHQDWKIFIDIAGNILTLADITQMSPCLAFLENGKIWQPSINEGLKLSISSNKQVQSDSPQPPFLSTDPEAKGLTVVIYSHAHTTGFSI